MLQQNTTRWSLSVSLNALMHVELPSYAISFIYIHLYFKIETYLKCTRSVPGFKNTILLFILSVCLHMFQLCRCGQGCRRALSLFSFLSLPGASQTQQQSKSTRSLVNLCLSLCLNMAGDDGMCVSVFSFVRWPRPMSNTPESMTWFSTATSKKQ